MAHEENAEYAQQWIAFLRRRNTVLSIIWPILLIVAVALTVVALFLYQQHLNDRRVIAEFDQEQQEIEEQLQTATQRIEELEDEKETRLAKISNLESEIEAFKGEASAQLNVSGKLVSTLKSKIATLENENDLLEDAVIKAKESASEVKNTELKPMQEMLDNYKEQVARLNEKLEARKMAYTALANRQKETRQEVDRLATAATKAREQISRKALQNKRLSEQLTQAQTRIDALRQENTELEEDLRLIVSPIGTNGGERRNTSPKSPKRADTTPQKPIMSPEATAATQSKGQKDSAAPAPFDHDKIVIDRP